MCPEPKAKKSPSGALTAGLFDPSQNISIFKPLSIAGLRSLNVIQIRRTVPLTPSECASTNSALAFKETAGDPLRPPLACAPRPDSPFGFSGLAHLVKTPSGTWYKF